MGVLIGVVLFLALYLLDPFLDLIGFEAGKMAPLDVQAVWGVGLVFAVMTCTILDAAMWHHIPRSAFSHINVALRGLLTSPIIWVVAATLVNSMYHTMLIDKAFIRFEIISWPFRAAIVVGLWRKAVRRLESGEFGGAA